MITAYVKANGTVAAEPIEAESILPFEAVWVDLFEPTAEEEATIECAYGLDLPTKEQMREIEVSSRLYQEGNALYMTATLLVRADTESPETVPVTFVLVGHRLVTLRYAEPRAFKLFAAQAERSAGVCDSGEAALTGLFDIIVDRMADSLERVQHELDAVSREIFSRDKKRAEIDFEEVLRRVGRSEDITSKARESLVSIGRLLSFLGRPGEGRPGEAHDRALATLARDVTSLSDHATFLANTINFLLDATLGMINIEQTGIIKIFSVAAVVFLPPTLIASIYGMNFEAMPELSWPIGYPIALGLMILSAALPYLYVKRRGWL